MHAAEDLTVLFHAVTNNTALTMRTRRRERMDRAFEAVKDVTLSAGYYFECLVIFVSADFALSHTEDSCAAIALQVSN